MEDLIKALIILKNYLSGYNLKYPTSCIHDILYVCGVDMDKITIDDVHKLYGLGFCPGSDEDCFSDDIDFATISQEEWDGLKGNLTDCFRSYKYGSC